MPLLSSDNARVRTLLLDRLAKKNAIDVELARELTAAFDAASRDPGVGAIVLGGQRDTFCAGADLSLFTEGGQDVAAVTSLHEVLLRCEKPLVASVNGLAVGMGVTLLPFFDLVYAADSATFMTPFVRLGLVLEYGSSFTLPRLIGRQRANELVLRAAPIDARTALEWGLVNRVFPRAALDAEVQQIATEVAANPAGAVRKSRDLLRQGEERTLAQALAAENEVLKDCYGSDENRAAAAAILNRKR
jgi:enoyl-CoA hydratase/carnithine racemase